MRINLCVWLSLGAVVSLRAINVNDPVLDAAKHVISSQQKADAHFDYWSHNIYLFRFNLDVTGDGKPELFLGSSSMVDRSPVRWSVYTSTSGGGVARTAENLLLYPSGFYLEHAGAPSRLRSVFSGPSQVTILQYSFSSDGTVQASVQEFAGEDARKMMGNDNWRDTLGLGVRVEELEIQKVLLAEYLENPTVAWRKYDHSHGPEAQHLAESEKPFLKQVEGFSAQRAVQLASAESITDPPTGSKPRSAPTPPVASAATVEKSTPQLKTPPTPAAVESESSSSFPLFPVAFVGVVILGIAIYALRRKSS